jgi:hypothetical protein
LQTFGFADARLEGYTFQPRRFYRVKDLGEAGASYEIKARTGRRRNNRILSSSGLGSFCLIPLIAVGLSLGVTAGAREALEGEVVALEVVVG